MSSTHRVEAHVREASLVGTTGLDGRTLTCGVPWYLSDQTVDTAAHKVTVEEHTRQTRRGN
jgi:L-asparaginase II